MQHKFLFSALATLAGLFTIASLHAGGGTDSFKVYLNNKLIYEHFLSQKFSLDALPLDEKNINDNLTFHYSHCGRIGTDRKLVVRDEKGKTLREWTFANAQGKQSGMVIPVREILQLRQQNLSLVYTANELPKGQLVASFRMHASATSWVPGQPVLTLLC